MLNTWNAHRQAQQKNMWTELRTWPSKRGIPLCKATNIVGILFGSIQSILKNNVNTSQIPPEFMSNLLSEEQKKNHVYTCHDLQDSLKDRIPCDLFLSKLLLALKRRGFNNINTLKETTLIRCCCYREIQYRNNLITPRMVQRSMYLYPHVVLLLLLLITQ